MSFAPQVTTTGDDTWVGNALRFATEKEAADNVHDLSMRWFAVVSTRVVESNDPVNYTYLNHKLEPVSA